MAYQGDIMHAFIQEMHILQERHTDFKERLKHVKWALEHNMVHFNTYYACFYSWFIRDINDNNDYENETYENEDIIFDNAHEEASEVARDLRALDANYTSHCTPIEWYALTELDTLMEVINEQLA